MTWMLTHKPGCMKTHGITGSYQLPQTSRYSVIASHTKLSHGRNDLEEAWCVNSFDVRTRSIKFTHHYNEKPYVFTSHYIRLKNSEVEHSSSCQMKTYSSTSSRLLRFIRTYLLPKFSRWKKTTHQLTDRSVELWGTRRRTRRQFVAQYII